MKRTNRPANKLIILGFSFLSLLLASFAEAQYTPDSIYTAARAGNIQLIKEQLKNRPSKGVLNNLLGAAVTGQQLEIIRFVVQKGADVDHLSSYNSPLINSAIMYGFIESAKELILLGADLEAQGFKRKAHNILINWYWTPLMCAARQGDEELIELLLENGADPEARGYSSDPSEIETAADIAAYSGHTPVLKILQEKGSLVNQNTIFKVLRGGHFDAFKLLLKKEEDINRIGPFGKTLLMEAAWWGYEDMVKYLLRKRANVNLLSKNGKTALMEVLSNPTLSFKKQYNLVKLLLKKKADVNLTGSKTTALSLARKYRRKEIAQLLIKKGAK